MRFGTLHLLLGLSLASSGCRYGYELLDPNGSVTPGTGGIDGQAGALSTGGTAPPDSLGGADATGGSDPNLGTGGGSGGTTPLPGDFIVTSSADPTESGETTLRDAILAVNGSGGDAPRITFAPGITQIDLLTDLPAITTSASIEGSGQILDFNAVAGNGDCLVVTEGTFFLDQIRIQGCPNKPIRFEGGSNHVVTNSEFVDNDGAIQVGGSTGATQLGPGNRFEGGTTYAVLLNAGSNTVTGNSFFDTGGSDDAAIGIFGRADGTFATGNLIVRATSGILVGPSVDSTKLWHNTIVGSLNTALDLQTGVNIDVRNNMLTDTMGSAVAYGSGITNFDYNLYFRNAAHCSGCPSGLGNNSKIQDPLYLEDGVDFRLQQASVAVDGGDTGTPLDRNGALPGEFNGSAPDIGAFEMNY